MRKELLKINYYTNFDGELYLPQPRVYLDSLADEFAISSYDEKLSNLAFLIGKGLQLTEVVMDYCDNHSEHIVSSLKPTLISYIQVLKYGEAITGMEEELVDFTEVELAMELENKIKQSLNI